MEERTTGFTYTCELLDNSNSPNNDSDRKKTATQNTKATKAETKHMPKLEFMFEQKLWLSS